MAKWWREAAERGDRTAAGSRGPDGPARSKRLQETGVWERNGCWSKWPYV